MATLSGLLSLSAGVAAFFTANGISAKVAPVGWRQREQQLNQGPGGANRVLFIPGDESGRAGSLKQPRQVSNNPRALVQWAQLVTMSVWAADAANKDDETAQISAAETLLEQAIQAVHYAQVVTDPTTTPPTTRAIGVANVVWGDVRWTVANANMYFGRELLVQFVYSGPLYDAPYGIATPQPAITRVPGVGPEMTVLPVILGNALLQRLPSQLAPVDSRLSAFAVTFPAFPQLSDVVRCTQVGLDAPTRTVTLGGNGYLIQNPITKALASSYAFTGSAGGYSWQLFEDPTNGTYWQSE